LSEKNYNEFGEIIVPYSFNTSAWLDFRQYGAEVNQTSSFQMISMLFWISTTIGLMAYSSYLQKKMLFRVPWRPPRRMVSPVHGDSLMNASKDSPSRRMGSPVHGDSSDSQSVGARSVAGRLSRINSGVLMMRARSNQGDDFSTMGDSAYA
jgi:hypothetical protein